jgi:hypothetical protein
MLASVQFFAAMLRGIVVLKHAKNSNTKELSA